MYARSTSVQGDPARVDEGIRFVREEVMPSVTGMDGCIGLSMLVDRGTGRAIVTTSWTSEEEMQATDINVSAFRSRAVEIMGSDSPEVRQWEIAVMHREHDAREGSWCRVTWMTCPPDEVETTLDFFRDSVLSRMEAVEGFCSASMLVDRSTGRCCATARFDSREDLDATREMTRAMREQSSQDRHVVFDDIEECELVIAHLRVPELV
jgi:heme-degrading monooxygenase HmoA